MVISMPKYGKHTISGLLVLQLLVYIPSRISLFTQVGNHFVIKTERKSHYILLIFNLLMKGGLIYKVRFPLDWKK